VASTDTVTATSKITRSNKQDTSAFILLDTTTNLLWHYKTASNRWLQAGGSTFDTTSIKYVNTYGIQTINGAKTISGITIFSNTDQAGNAASAPVTFLGGVGIAKNLRVAGDIVADGPNKSIATLNGGDMQFYNTGNNQFGRISSNAGAGGNIRFQTNGSVNALDLAAAGGVTVFNLSGTGSRAVLSDANGLLSAPVSSINTKENVQILDYGLNELLQINPVSFDYINKDKWGDERNLGFIVEDIFPVVPEVTGTMNNGDMYLDMTKLIPILTKAIQEQQALIKALEQRIINLENK
jgi:hypothetical protein